MIINWKKNCIKVVSSKKLNKSFNLLPGHNYISNEDWKVIAKEFKLDEGYENQFLEVITEAVKVREGNVTKEKKADDFSDFSEEKAKLVVAEMYSIKDLKELMKKEKRTDIRYIIEQRIDELKQEKSVSTIANRNER